MIGVDAGRIAALGETVRVQGFGLAGVVVLPADGAEEVRAAWRSLPPDVGILILTADAARVLGETERARPLIVVMPS